MGRQTYTYMVVWRMRAKTIPHVEYEIFLHVMNEIDILAVKESMCPKGDKHAEERFNKGAKSAKQLIQNLIDRRKHRLPEDHMDYEVKE